MSDELRAQIDGELEKLRELAGDLSQRVKAFKEAPPDRWDCGAAGAALHSFYGGIESIFRAVAESIDGGLHKSDSWHSDFLESMTASTPRRRNVISPSLAARLDEYLGFRHVFRSRYGADLEWERMVPLVEGLPGVFDAFEKEVREFLAGRN